MIGDMTGDIELGKRLGMKTILVKTGCAGQDNIFDVNPDHVADNLSEAVKHIIIK